jgi:hypothetical protein
MSQPQSPSEDAESDHRQQQHQTHPASPSGGENDHQSSHLVNDQQRQASEPDMQGPDSLEYDFEVKEQDRWLPIANGKLFVFVIRFFFSIPRLGARPIGSASQRNTNTEVQ